MSLGSLLQAEAVVQICRVFSIARSAVCSARYTSACRVLCLSTAGEGGWGNGGVAENWESIVDLAWKNVSVQ